MIDSNKHKVSDIKEIELNHGDVYLNHFPNNPKTGDICLKNGCDYVYHNGVWVKTAGKIINKKM